MNPETKALQERYQTFVQHHLSQRKFKGDWVEIVACAIVAMQGKVKFWPTVKVCRAMKKDSAGWRSFLQKAVPVMAYPLMVNSILRRPGSKSSAGLVLMSFDERASTKFMVDLAERVFERRADSEEDRAFLTSLFADERFVLNRRRRLPVTVTGDIPVYACDLWMIPQLLHQECVNAPLMPCMAEPGDTGRINVMPWWLVNNVPPPLLKLDPNLPGQMGIVFSVPPEI